MAVYVVTGGGGFIGSHIVEELLRRGEETRVIDNFSTGKRENVAVFRDRAEVIEADIAEAMAYMNQKWEVARSGGKGWDRLEAATQGARDEAWLARAQPATKLEDIIPSWTLQMEYDPMPAIERVTCPVLAVFGELDTSTPVAATVAAFHKGLRKAGNSDYTIKVFPGADHALLVWPRPGDQAHWPVLAAGYLDTLTTWIISRGSR